MDKRFFALGIFAVFIFFLPYFILGESSYVIVGDNLDSNVVWFKVIAESGHLLSPNLTPVDGIMGELPRLSYPSEMNAITWLYYFFQPWQAFVINLIMIRMVAFVSMFLLLSKLTTKRNMVNLSLVTSISLLFAYQPFWPTAGLSVAGQPLLIYLFLEITEKKKAIWPFVLLFFYTFYSSLVLSGLFAGIFLFGWFVALSIYRKRIIYRFLPGILILVLGYIIANYRLFLSVLEEQQFGFVSHRTEWQVSLHSDFWDKFLQYLIQGQYHATLLPSIFAPLLLISIPFLFFKKKFYEQPVFGFMSATFLAIFLAVFVKWEGVSLLYEKLPLFTAFQFNRFYFLIPALAFISVYFILKKIMGKAKYGFFLTYTIIALAFLQSFRNVKMYSVLARTEVLGRETVDPTYKGFYSQRMFEEIKEVIKDPEAGIINFGIHPSVAQFNGLLTIDGYMANYPVEKKHQFLNMLGQKWKQSNPRSFKYLNSWGSRLYIYKDHFYHEKIRYKWSPLTEQEVELDIQWNAVREMGGHYLLSTNPISDVEVSLVQFFEDKDSAWQLYLYKL